jgi:hypothetical protein
MHVAASYKCQHSITQFLHPALPSRLVLFRGPSANVMLRCTTLSTAYRPPVLLNTASGNAALSARTNRAWLVSARVGSVVDSNRSNRHRLATPQCRYSSELIDRRKHTYAGTMQEQTARNITTTLAYRDPKRTLVGQQLHLLPSILVCIYVTSCLADFSGNLI